MTLRMAAAHSWKNKALRRALENQAWTHRLRARAKNICRNRDKKEQKG